MSHLSLSSAAGSDSHWGFPSAPHRPLDHGNWLRIRGSNVLWKTSESESESAWGIIRNTEVSVQQSLLFKQGCFAGEGLYISRGILTYIAFP